MYTPQDSIVFGGNFLHKYNIQQQFKCYELEGLTGMMAHHRINGFEKIIWYAGFYEIYPELKGIEIS